MKEDSEKTREIVSNDLRTWQEKFAKASDKGAADLEQRIQELTDLYIQRQVQGVGKSLLVELEDTAKDEVAKLKTNIIYIVEPVVQGSDEDTLSKAREQIDVAVRRAALAVKDKAQALRNWKENSQNETLSLIEQAAHSTLAVIDDIRDLGLQEIGMKWTWMEGITYKDWERFHELRKTVDGWRKEVWDVAQRHDGLDRAKFAANEVESQGMAVAEEAAKELARLKNVGKWKLATRDTTDDFSDKYAPPVVANAGQVVMEKAQDAREGVEAATDSAASYASGASSKIKEAASSASAQFVGSEKGSVEEATSRLSERVYGTEQPMAESVASGASSRASQASSRVAESVAKNAEGASDAVKDAAASVSSAAGDVASKISEGVIGSRHTQDATDPSAVSEKIENAASGVVEAVRGSSSSTHAGRVADASESVKSVVSRASEALSGEETTAEGVAASASSIAAEASSAASQAPKKVWGGAAAQKVKERPIHYDVVVDDEDEKSAFSDTVQSMVSEAGDNLSDMTKAVREAIFGTTTAQGSVESASSLASEQYSRALSAASSVLYGTPQGTAEGVASAASKRYADAVSA